MRYMTHFRATHKKTGEQIEFGFYDLYRYDDKLVVWNFGTEPRNLKTL